MSRAPFQPLHARIRDQVHRRIVAGDLGPGDRLPSESQIMTQFKVSRGTVNRALRDLEREGVLQRRRGAGTFVRKPPAGRINRQIAMFTPWAATGESIKYVPSLIHHALGSVCSENDLLLSLQCLPSGGATLRERMLDAARSLLDRHIGMVLFCPLELPHEQMHWNREVVDLLTAGGAKVILFDRDIATHPERSEHAWVSFDNARGSAMLVKHLHAQGYRRIAFIGIEAESTAVEQRLSGYQNGLRLCGLPVDETLQFNTCSPDAAFCKRMMRTARPDAIVCKDSPLAALIGQLLAQRGLRIGPDVGLAGFDDDPFMKLLPVPLTVIRQPIEPFVAAIYRVIQAGLLEHGLPYAGEQIVIRTELVPRASTQRQ